MLEILLATKNQHKLKEIRDILNGYPVTLRTISEFPLIPEVTEDGDTFSINALKKAKTCYMISGLISLADDSGLEVDALDGRPGVHSARYSGQPHDYIGNNKKLLEELQTVPPAKRTARFHCVIALTGLNKDQESFERFFHGTCEGIILNEERGTNGFGYDPVFYIPQYGQTMAELEPALKNQISHRANAMKKFRHFLDESINELL
jgi:XTP/dITP diphosphohydrolase